MEVHTFTQLPSMLLMTIPAVPNIDAEHVAHDNSNNSHIYPRDLSTTGQFTNISLDLQN